MKTQHSKSADQKIRTKGILCAQMREIKRKNTLDRKSNVEKTLILSRVFLFWIRRVRNQCFPTAPFLFLEAAFQTILPSGIFSDTVLEILSKETNVKSDLNLYQSDFEFQSRCRYACPIIYNHMSGALFEQRYDIFIFQYFSFFFRKGFLYDKK